MTLLKNDNNFIQSILDNALDYAILTTTMDGTIVSWNKGAEKLFGWKDHEIIGQSLELLFTLEDRANNLAATRRQMARHHRIDPVERFHIRKDGRQFWASGDLQLLYGKDGTPEGFLKIVRDRTEAQQQAEALRISEERLRLAQTAASIGAFEIDPKHTLFKTTPQFLKLLGLEENTALSFHDFLAFITQGQDQILDYFKNDLAMDRLFQHKDSAHHTNKVFHTDIEIKRANDSQLRWLAYWAETIEDTVNKNVPPRIIGVLQDITEQRLYQEKQTMVSNELAHRVKNILTIVQSIANQTFMHATSTKDALNVFSKRIAALAKAQDLLTKGTDKGADLRVLISQSLDIYDEMQSRFFIDGPSLKLSSQAVLTMVLALHELCTNAVKYGALSNDKGIIIIKWQLQDKEFFFYWQEKDGPKIKNPHHKGFGSTLIERLLPANLKAITHLTYATDGLLFELRAPFDKDSFPDLKDI
ncbi:sensor histidine kinase [Bartonella tamiae]|uniref:Blue-light-activated histidine kinase n=1 Tax=Bartonella tamiae Th239 TaxID=1094558 RepID=J1K320_9HYPH|nr:HWE histidine kinase domain-containing protein [Bartonella tamiae]EJF91495.1 PAS domain S-box protein [Bartonella tamiae Th239]EJF92521.1 PAS domain S-box protein [Bartonella tamiae Th307]